MRSGRSWCSNRDDSSPVKPIGSGCIMDDELLVGGAEFEKKSEPNVAEFMVRQRLQWKLLPFYPDTETVVCQGTRELRDVVAGIVSR